MSNTRTNMDSKPSEPREMKLTQREMKLTQPALKKDTRYMPSPTTLHSSPAHSWKNSVFLATRTMSKTSSTEHTTASTKLTNLPKSLFTNYEDPTAQAGKAQSPDTPRRQNTSRVGERCASGQLPVHSDPLSPKSSQELKT
jgi:hypothetical protein